MIGFINLRGFSRQAKLDISITITVNYSSN
jgi:hypothetical protein